ncbi:PREDICTED: endocuticle structural glycoprotein SgAbd-5-like [Nicrophorus vespilloides]|uniref:Endocuticle structural glycoprotein SgAbd-5-like n=1 Tax=Nicrophorus vespilloides TaxID=110193 RepID=A0ABM1N8X0_NICVS|nr:PREDICTED: endocuticle structural glycoprotein SgAbd-5-like [Nicrophorus vespilloides]
MFYAVTANEVGILLQEAEINQYGSYKFNYESEDGTKVSQTGSLKNVNNKDVQIAEGSYSYHGDDGKDVVVKYVADENGNRPIGDNIPASIFSCVFSMSVCDLKLYPGIWHHQLL